MFLRLWSFKHLHCFWMFLTSQLPWPTNKTGPMVRALSFAFCPFLCLWAIKAELIKQPNIDGFLVRRSLTSFFLGREVCVFKDGHKKSKKKSKKIPSKSPMLTGGWCIPETFVHGHRLSSRPLQDGGSLVSLCQQDGEGAICCWCWCL